MKTDRWGAAFQTGGAVAAGLAAAEYLKRAGVHGEWVWVAVCLLGWVVAAVAHGVLGCVVSRSERG